MRTMTSTVAVSRHRVIQKATDKERNKVDRLETVMNNRKVEKTIDEGQLKEQKSGSSVGSDVMATQSFRVTEAFRSLLMEKR